MRRRYSPSDTLRKRGSCLHTSFINELFKALRQVVQIVSPFDHRGSNLIFQLASLGPANFLGQA